MIFLFIYFMQPFERFGVTLTGVSMLPQQLWQSYPARGNFDRGCQCCPSSHDKVIPNMCVL